MISGTETTFGRARGVELDGTLLVDVDGAAATIRVGRSQFASGALAMALLIDIGNTRIKWARFEDGALQPQSAAPHADWNAQTFVDTVLAARQPQRSSAGQQRRRSAHGRRRARRRSRRRGRSKPSSSRRPPLAGGIRNAYPQPAKLGVDRWLAMIGAHALERGAVCVVSVGTAMTIDGVAADGRHLGGVIVPGPDLMVVEPADRIRATSRSARSRAARPTDLFADNTLGAIRQGAEQALAALVERAVGVMRRTLTKRRNCW